MASAPADLLGVTDETFNMIKATTTSGWLYSLGAQGVDLGDLISLVPVKTPFYASTPRIKPPQGAQVAYWRALLNVNNQQPNPAVGNDYAGGLVLFEEQDVYAPFVPLRNTGRVTQDAVDEAQGYANALAVATMQVVNQNLIGQDIHGINSQAFALPTIGTVAKAASTTGGLITASTVVSVVCQARAGWNYYYGGSGVASSAASVTTASTTSTNSVAASVAAVKSAVAYDWFVNTFYYATTTSNTVTVTFIPTANQALSVLPLLYNTAPTAAATADSSYSANNFNGLIASTLGDWGSGSTGLVTPLSATSQGAYWKSLDGAALTLEGTQAITELDALNLAIYNLTLLGPTRYIMSQIQAQEISELIQGSGSVETFLQPDDLQGRQNMIVGTRAAIYVNKATADPQPIKIESHPHCPPGTIIAMMDRIDYPGANIDAPYSFRVQRDLSQFAYGANFTANTAGGGPRNDFDITTRLTFANRVAPLMGILSNVG